MEVETGEVGSGAAKEVVGAALGVGVVDEDVDVFDAGEVTDDLGVDPGDGLELAGPVFGVVGPGDPGGGVRRPFGGHAISRLRICFAAHLVLLLLGRIPLPGQKVCKIFHSRCLGLDSMCSVQRSSLKCWLSEWAAAVRDSFGEKL